MRVRSSWTSLRRCCSASPKCRLYQPVQTQLLPLSTTTLVSHNAFIFLSLILQRLSLPDLHKQLPGIVIHVSNVDMNSPVPPSPSPGPRPLQLVDGNVQSPTDSSFPPTPVSGLSTPPPSARKFNPRRQSSISYYPSDHTPSWDLRSPTTAGPGPSSLRRSTSLNQKIPARLDLKGDRRSLPSSGVEVVEGPVTDRPPLTLTEKYVLPAHFCVYPIALRQPI